LSNLGDKELVSVVIPSYNHENYIVSALGSVAQQTYPNLELVIIDDGSLDETLAIADEWSSSPDVDARFSAVRLLKNHTNLGAHASINRGIHESTGSIISLMNSDDIYHPERITKLVDIMGSRKTEFAFSKVLAVDDNTEEIPPWQLPLSLQNVFDFADVVESNFPALSFGFLAQNMAISTGNFVFRRNLYEKIGPFKPLLYVHDWEFIVRAIFECEPAYLSEELYFYRIHSNNSFSRLAHVGEVEGLIVAETFYRMAQNKIPKNMLAPVPYNWPTVLEIYREKLLMLNKVL
jgi:glycosyltransferase involved in cell wall biosynthesis